MKNPTIETTLTCDVEYAYVSEGGQQMRGKLPAGLKLNLPIGWVYETAEIVAGKVTPL